MSPYQQSKHTYNIVNSSLRRWQGEFWLMEGGPYSNKNQQFKPLKPSFEEFERVEPSNGSIYSTSSSGLFSSDRRAKKVGDILSVTLSETFSSNKAVTNSSAKADNIGAEVGGTGILRNFAGFVRLKKKHLSYTFICINFCR